MPSVRARVVGVSSGDDPLLFLKHYESHQALLRKPDSGQNSVQLLQRNTSNSLTLRVADLDCGVFFASLSSVIVRDLVLV